MEHSAPSGAQHQHRGRRRVPFLDAGWTVPFLQQRTQSVHSSGGRTAGLRRTGAALAFDLQRTRECLFYRCRGNRLTKVKRFAYKTLYAMFPAGIVLLFSAALLAQSPTPKPSDTPVPE